MLGRTRLWPKIGVEKSWVCIQRCKKRLYIRPRLAFTVSQWCNSKGSALKLIFYQTVLNEWGVDWTSVIGSFFSTWFSPQGSKIGPELEFAPGQAPERPSANGENAQILRGYCPNNTKYFATTFLSYRGPKIFEFSRAFLPSLSSIWNLAPLDC